MMKVHTKIVLDMNSGAIEHADFYMYEGPVALCDPSILGILGTVVSIVGTLSGGASDQAASNFEADTQRQQAAREREISAAEARKFEREQSALKARSRAVRSGSGVGTTSGSSLLVDQDIAAEIARNKALIKAGGETRATRLEQNASLLGLRGRNARRASLFKAGTALTGEGKFL